MKSIIAITLTGLALVACQQQQQVDEKCHDVVVLPSKK